MLANEIILLSMLFIFCCSIAMLIYMRGKIIELEAALKYGKRTIKTRRKYYK